MMKCTDVIMLIINIIITLFSLFGAYKSFRYYKKSKLLTIHTNLNKSLLEVEKMIHSFSDALVSNRNKKRGENVLLAIGKQMISSYTEIHKSIPVEISDEIKAIENSDLFNLRTYINKLINGENSIFDKHEYELCQNCLFELQLYLKKKIEENQEKLK